MKLSKLIVGCLMFGLLLVAQHASADKAVAPRRVEPAKTVIPVQVKHTDLKGEGDGVQAKIVLPARLREAAAGAKAPSKVGLNEEVAPTQRSIVAAIALSLAAVSVVFVLRGKKLNLTAKAAVLGVAGLLAIFGAAQADIAIPGQKRNPRPVPPPEPVAKSSIVIEFSSDVEEAILTLPSK
jgi:hypothetical protein